MLAIGTRIGSYEVLAPLGSGGMGDVFRARDTRLGRDVALKSLPPSFAADADRLARFAREGQVLAALNHRGIAAIYGVEESASGTVLVLELVEGPTLADRLAHGPMPADEALAIAAQIADALEVAHEQGIIHRDLKPANLKIRPDGAVKVLDFGLARSAAPTDSGAAVAGPVISPTITAPGTALGMLLGTPAYMAPEQARGLTVDRRADIWSFGVVLFEMLAGRPPFDGATISDVLAAIIKESPDWRALPPTLPPDLRRLLRRLLEKDPRRRVRDMGDVRLALDDLRSAATDSAPPAPEVHDVAGWRRMLPWAVAAVMTIAALAAAVAAGRGRQPIEPPTLKYSLPSTVGTLERLAMPVLSPDGKHVAFVRNLTLWVQTLDSLEPRALAGATSVHYPFWSPDSREIAYLTPNTLWRVPIDGGPPVRVAAAAFSKGGRTPGGAWLADGTIVFAPAATGSGLLSVPARGGEFTDYYQRNADVEGDFHRPSVLPDGRSLVFVVDRVGKSADTIGLLVDGVRKDVLTLEGEVIDAPVYSPTGHILYHRETTIPGLWALPFSFERQEAAGEPFLVTAQASFPSVGRDGLLVYAGGVSGQTRLAWLEIRSGVVTPATMETFLTISQPRLSPDGTQVAAVARLRDQGSEMADARGQWVIVVDLRRQTYVRLADRAYVNSRPTWRDNRTIIYATEARVGDQLVMRAADGSGDATELGRGMHPQVVADTLLFAAVTSGRNGGLYRRSLASASGTASELVESPAHEVEPTLSPDGQLLAYTRGEPGQTGVLLQRYPSGTGQWQVSTQGGGSMPVWSRAGDALYYRRIGGDVLRVAVHAGASMTLGRPEVIKRPADLIAVAGFDVSPDGTRLLMVQEVTTGDRPPAMAVVQNWLAEFRK